MFPFQKVKLLAEISFTNYVLVRAQAEAEVFKMVTSGKRGKKAWKRMVSYLFTDNPLHG